MSASGRGRLVVLAAVALCLPPAVGALAAPKFHAHCAPAHVAGGEWRSYGHDYSNTRNQPKEHLLTRLTVPTLQPAFAFAASDAGGDGDFTGTPVIADGCMFIGSTTGWVFATNADTGKPVWSTHVDPFGGEIASTPYVGNGQVFVSVGRTGQPYVAALDERTGRVLWRTVLDRQDGADAYGSPVVFDGLLFEGISGGSAELADEGERYAFQGAYVIVETRGPHAGRILRKVYTVQHPAKNAKQGGSTVWATPAIDPVHKVAYVGTGNPFHPQTQGKYADALLKIDLDRESRRFGDIVGHYDGVPEEYQPYTRHTPCVDTPGNAAPYYPQGAGACGDLDLDFGASPNLIRTESGRVLVGEGQKAGVYHLIDGRTMKRVWRSTVGPPSSLGGIVGSTAYDGNAIYGPITLGGYVWSIGRTDGRPRWVTPVADGAHWGNPVSTAGGVVYTVGLTGFLDAYDAQTGVPLLHHPMDLDGDGNPAASWGGVSIARHTVYAAVGMTGLPNGLVIAYRPGGLAGLGSSANAGASPSPGVSQVLSGPEGQEYGYLTPVVVTRQGGPVSYTNIDIVRHNVVQDVRADHVHGPSTASWCRQFRKRQCPLFWTPLIGLGQSTSVRGLGHTKPGTYSFYCTIHPGMKGTLVVLP